jgi:carbon storage regulator
MLILSRKAGEGILIGEDITLKLLEIEGERVKIGIDAPKAMKILRLELYEEVRDENKKALASLKYLSKLSADISQGPTL